MVKATEVNAGLAESNGRLLLGIWRELLHVTCGLTACTPGSAPGRTLGNEYGKTLPFTLPLMSKRTTRIPYEGRWIRYRIRGIVTMSQLSRSLTRNDLTKISNI